jgi:hypothetical protein
MSSHLLFAAVLLAAPGLFAVLRPGRCQTRIQVWGRRGFWLWPATLGIAAGAFLLHGSHDPLRLDTVSLLGWVVSAAALVLLVLPPTHPQKRILTAGSVRAMGALLSIIAAVIAGLGLGALRY